MRLQSLDVCQLSTINGGADLGQVWDGILEIGGGGLGIYFAPAAGPAAGLAALGGGAAVVNGVYDVVDGLFFS